MKLIDYTADSPQRELELALCRTDAEGLGDFTSWEGRSICLLKVATHAASIVIKPAYYLTLGFCSMLISCLSLDSFSEAELQQLLRDQPTSADITVFRNNSELLGRMSVIAKNSFWTAPVAIVSQIIQVCKAALGILIPGVYFRHDFLSPLMRRCATIAAQLKCEPELINKLNEGLEAIQLDGFNREYFIAQYIEDFTSILVSLEDPAIPDPRKQSVLSLLNPESEKREGIESCPTGLGRLLQRMKAAIKVPENPAEVVPYLSTQFKEEIINEMVLDTENAKITGNWKEILKKLAVDQGHRLTALVYLIGDKIGVTEQLWGLVENDPWITSEGIDLPEDKRALLLEEFHRRCGEDKQIEFLLSQINSQPDGSPGLQDFRDQVIQALASTLEADDPALAAVTQYQLNEGQGNPSENPGFNDLNEKAIKILLTKKYLFPLGGE